MNVPKLLVVAAFAALAAGCGGPAKTELHIYTWSDYIDSGVIKDFEKQNNCRIVVDTFDSNEAMFAKLQAGSTGYDIITPSSYQIPLMVRNGMLQKLDKSLIPNVAKNFDKSYLRFILAPEMDYNVPYIVTYTGFVYRKDKVGDAPVDSWKVLETDALKGRISLLSDMRETIGGALMFLGYSMNSTNAGEIAAAADLVIVWKKNIAKFDNEQYKTAVASGEFFLGHGYSSDAIQIMLDDDKIGFSFPKEGFSTACDEMVIASTAKNVGLAHAFINYLYQPEVAVRNMESVCGPMPVEPALKALPEKFRSIPALCPSEDILRLGQVIRDFDDQPAVRDLYIKAWDRIKATESK